MRTKPLQGRLMTVPVMAILVIAASGILHAYSAPRCGPLSFHEASQDSSPFSLQGKITKAEAGKFTVNTEENILFHIRYDDKTAITRADGTAGSSKDLRAGVWVGIRGDLEESGEIAAATIKILKQPPQK